MSVTTQRRQRRMPNGRARRAVEGRVLRRVLRLIELHQRREQQRRRRGRGGCVTPRGQR